MSTSQPETKPENMLLRTWRGMAWRWKMILTGIGMGIFAICLWTVPAAYYALKGGYTGHGVFYIAATIVGTLLSTAGMHLLGIRHEREMDEKD